MKKNSGFSLVELMIVIGIVGILAAVGYPAYTSFVTKGNRADGMDALLKEYGLLEEYYVNNDTYTNATLSSASSAEGKYAISLNVATGGFSYMLTATPNLGDSECGNLTLDSLGERKDTGAGDCW